MVRSSLPAVSLVLPTKKPLDVAVVMFMSPPAATI
jgi:hypothetical protein